MCSSRVTTVTSDGDIDDSRALPMAVCVRDHRDHRIPFVPAQTPLNHEFGGSLVAFGQIPTTLVVGFRGQ